MCLQVNLPKADYLIFNGTPRASVPTDFSSALLSTHSTSAATTLGDICKKWVKEALCLTPVISAEVYPSKFV